MVVNTPALAFPSSPITALFPRHPITSFSGADNASSRKRARHQDSMSRSSLQLVAPTSDDSGDSRRPWQFHVAPMQGYTSYPLRMLFRYLSQRGQENGDDDSPIILWTEMEKVEDLLNTNQNGWEKRFGSPNDGDSDNSCIMQLGGSDPELVQQCIYQAAEYGYLPNNFCGINLNCGCPSIESGGAATYGASLMRKPELTGQLVEAVSETLEKVWGKDCGVEVSVKTRIAAVDTPEDLLLASATNTEDAEWTLDEEKYACLHQYITEIQGGGADHIILHARPAVLSGLSPVKNRIVPKLDYNAVQRVANDFPCVRVTLNGGISCLADLKAVMNDYGSEDVNGKQGVSSYMAGRWMLRRPFDLLATNRSSRGLQRHNVDVLATKAIGNYIDYVDQALGRLERGDTATPTKAELFLPLYLVVEQLREDYDYLQCEGMDLDDDITGQRISIDTAEDIYEMIVEYLLQLEGGVAGGKRKKSKIPSVDEFNFKKLASSFKGIVGTKVASKWKRNRAEL